jgi:hypothetical protein
LRTNNLLKRSTSVLKKYDNDEGEEQETRPSRLKLLIPKIAKKKEP